MMGWIEEAPRRSIAACAPATLLMDDGSMAPGVAFMFGNIDQGPESAMTVMLVASVPHLRNFQRELDKAITQATRRMQGEMKRQRAANGGSNPE